jgi:hypothetical protein
VSAELLSQRHLNDCTKNRIGDRILNMRRYNNLSGFARNRIYRVYLQAEWTAGEVFITVAEKIRTLNKLERIDN